MTSPAQFAANKANAAHSAGPTTDAGKQRSSRNAYKHGLTGQIYLFTADEHQAFEKHCQSIVQALAPVGVLEQQLAQSIAEGHWRLNRARAIESGIFALGQSREPVDPLNPFDPDMLHAFSQAKTWFADGKNIQLLSLYEQRIQRSIEKQMAELRTLRAERQAARRQALEEAVLLAQLAQSKGEKYDAAADFPAGLIGIGSEFSPTAINLLIARTQRLNEARDHANKPIRMPAAA